MNNLQGFGTARFFEIGGHATDGVKFEVSRATASKFCSFETQRCAS